LWTSGRGESQKVGGWMRKMLETKGEMGNVWKRVCRWDWKWTQRIKSHINPERIFWDAVTGHLNTEIPNERKEKWLFRWIILSRFSYTCPLPSEAWNFDGPDFHEIHCSFRVKGLPAWNHSRTESMSAASDSSSRAAWRPSLATSSRPCNKVCRAVGVWDLSWISANSVSCVIARTSRAD
jgi:hypothetical protein